MKKIVIGCPGSGKTTFAEKLSKLTNLPLYYLDAIWHKPDRTHITREEYDKRLSEIFELDEWIIDGNYSRTVEKGFRCAIRFFCLIYPQMYVCRELFQDLGSRVMMFRG